MTQLSALLRSAVLRLADAPQRTLTKVAERLSSGPVVRVASIPPPDHVTTRLETVFEALSELAFQPDIATALELACETLQAELPTEATAAGLYDIDADQFRFAVARGVGAELLAGTTMARGRCLVGYAADAAVIARGGKGGVNWIGQGEDGATVLLCPILHDGNLLGLLALADPLCAADFSRHDLDLVRYVAEQLATFIHAHRQRPRTGQ